MKLIILIVAILMAALLYTVMNSNGDPLIDGKIRSNGNSIVNTVPKNIISSEKPKIASDVNEALNSKKSNDLLEKLDELTTRGVSGNSKNIDELDVRFRRGKLSQEKVALARLYNIAYFGTEDILIRERISRTLSDLLKAETDPLVGRALALSHSRLIFNEQTKENLSFAYKKKFLSDNDYYGELVHVLPGASALVKTEIFKEFIASKNQYASEIMVDLISNSNQLEISKDEAVILRNHLTKTEPTFGGSPSSFGMIDGIRYEQWVKALAYLESKESSSSFDLLLLNKLASPSIDPRGTIAFLISPYAEILIKQPKYRENMKEIVQKAEKFIAQNPSELSLQQAGAEISRLSVDKK